MSSDKLDLEIVTPERRVLSLTVDEVVLPGSEGYLGVLPGHAPLLTALVPGMISVRAEGRQRYLAVSGGFLEVLRDRVTVLATTCEGAEEINLERAQQAREKAEAILKSEASEQEFRRAELKLKKALARIEVHGRAES